MFGDLLMRLVREMPVGAAGRLEKEHGNRIWRVLNHHVHEARAPDALREGVKGLGAFANRPEGLQGQGDRGFRRGS